VSPACSHLDEIATSPRTATDIWTACASGPSINWPQSSAWEEGFHLTGADDGDAEINPYDPTGAKPSTRPQHDRLSGGPTAVSVGYCAKIAGTQCWWRTKPWPGWAT
jgi:hypothetical protein